MSEYPEKKKVYRQFTLTNLSLRNKNSIYLLIVVLLGFGIYSYNSMPKELFPDIVIPTIMVQTIYPGNPPADMENLVTRPLEKEIESTKGVKEIRSTSSQDISAIFVEFNTDVEIKVALQDVKDAVDNAKSELPNDLPQDPIVTDIDFSEFPIIYINLSGDYSINELKRYAEFLEEEIERVPEISKVDIVGLNEREIKVNVDQYKMQTLEISFTDIENAINYENISMSGGEILTGGTRRSIRIIGEFKSVEEIGDIIVKYENENIVHLKDIATIEDGFADPKDFARLNKQPVVSLHVIKKGGENLLNATDQIFDILELAREDGSIPQALNVTLTNDQSDIIRKQLSNLENSMIMGVLLVIIILYLFLGTRNALFVGYAIPMSMFVSFVILGLLGTRINMIVLFSLILSLGMLVDNAIVVVENIYRFLDRGYTRFEASRLAAGEIAIPIIASTATTLAAFFPLLFWDSLMGEFMKWLPLVLIITLSSSLLVALVFIPAFTSSFMRTGDQVKKPNRKKTLILAGAMILFSVIFYAFGNNPMGTILSILALIGIANILFLNSTAQYFQNRFLPWLEKNYSGMMSWVLAGRHPMIVILSTFGLLIFTLVLFSLRAPKVVLFPSMDPQYINVIATLPVGTDITITNQFSGTLEDNVITVLNPYQSIIKSVMTTVGSGARSENDMFDISETPNRCMITITFVDYEFRGGINTFDIMGELTDALVGRYPGVSLSVEKQNEGPPAGKDINIEIIGRKFDKLIEMSEKMKAYIDAADIPGIEGLNIDLDVGKPELIVHIDRERARRYGLSTAQISSTIRTALFGKDVSDFKVGEDEYPIQLRLKEEDRNNVSNLMNQMITFRNQSNGKIVQVPISAVADITYTTTYDAIKRKDLDRMVTVYSNVIEGYNATEINNQLKVLLANFEMPTGYSFKFTGEQEEQAESMAFLEQAMLIAIALIMIILVSQFNSIVKPLIIMASVLFSTIGVFGGLSTFRMDFIVIMTGIGLISLAGIVVNNAIVLIDYTDLLKKRKRRELGMEENAILPRDIATDCVIEAGKTRLRPVLLTAITTILGLIPLASGLNIDFISFFETLDPKIYFGGDNVAFWGPLSWTVIFGLTFSTLLTLIVVPSMYQALYFAKVRISNWSKGRKPTG